MDTQQNVFLPFSYNAVPECHYSEFHNSEFNYVECHCAECYYVECHHAVAQYDYTECS